MRLKIFYITSAVFVLPAAPVHAHWGHVGELAGHGHVVGIAALAGAAALAAALAAARGKRTEKEQEEAEEIEAEGESA